MAFEGINYLAVLAALVAAFLFGAAYYTLLAKPWMAAIGKTAEEVKAGAGPLVYFVTAAAQLVMSFMLAGVMGHLGGEAISASGGLIVGFSVWLGFVLTTLVVNHSFQGAKRSLTVIDGGHWLGALLIQGFVIGLIGL